MLRRFRNGLVYAAICSLAALCPLHAESFNGMSYTTDFSNNEIGDAEGLQSLLKMSQMGTNFVTINAWWFTPSTTSTTIAPNTSTKYGTTDASLEAAISYAHSLGMKVMLKPMLDVNNGTWRANINPSAANRNTWFANYSSFIDHYATIAQAYNVEMLSVGCEMCDVEQYTSNWTTVINNARGIYSGPLTYSANWSPNGSLGGYTNVAWWNQLDEVGIDAYFNLTNNNDPTEASLQSAWTNEANSLHTWLSNYNASNSTNLKMMFTETGYASYVGTNKTPYSGPSNSTSPAVDLTEQANCYQALMTVMSQQSWWDGANWWNWDSNPNDGGSSNNNYTPQNKPAQQVLSQFYLLRGDFNLDHQITNADLQAMLNALKNESSYESTYFFNQADINALGDFNGDGVVNAADIQGELALLTGSSGGGSTAPVPEPSSLLLLAGAAVLWPAVARRHGLM